MWRMRGIKLVTASVEYRLKKETTSGVPPVYSPAPVINISSVIKLGSVFKKIPKVGKLKDFKLLISFKGLISQVLIHTASDPTSSSVHSPNSKGVQGGAKDPFKAIVAFGRVKTLRHFKVLKIDWLGESLVIHGAFECKKSKGPSSRDRPMELLKKYDPTLEVKYKGALHDKMIKFLTIGAKTKYEDPSHTDPKYSLWTDAWIFHGIYLKDWDQVTFFISLIVLHMKYAVKIEKTLNRLIEVNKEKKEGIWTPVGARELADELCKDLEVGRVRVNCRFERFLKKFVVSEIQICFDEDLNVIAFEEEEVEFVCGRGSLPQGSGILWL